QRERERRIVREVALVAAREVRRQFAVRRGDTANPGRHSARVVVWAPDEMDDERLRLMNVAGPEQADVAVLESVAARDALEGEFDDPIVEELIAQTTLQSPVWRRRLV